MKQTRSLSEFSCLSEHTRLILSFSSFLGLDSQIPLTTYKLDDDVDDCRVFVETEDINDIVTSMIR